VKSDTIAAIATAPGRGGIGVVRVSGRELLPLAERLTGKTL
jgi:tRNA modification GTPase